MLRALNGAMLDQFNDEDQFCTVAVVRMTSERVRVACGGHPLPLVVRRAGDVEAGRAPARHWVYGLRHAARAHSTDGRAVRLAIALAVKTLSIGPDRAPDGCGPVFGAGELSD